MSIKQTNLSDIADFLASAKKLMVAGEYLFVTRRKNLQALSECGLTVADVKSEIIGLHVEIITRVQSGILIKLSQGIYGNLRKT